MVKSHDIQDYLRKHFANYVYELHHTYVFGWESDFFAVAKQTDYVIEVEIKVSRSDFKADFQKTTFHENINKHSYLQDKTKKYKPNKFAFACPDGLIKPDEIPPEYGLFYLEETKYESPQIHYSNYFRCVRGPKFLHKENLFQDRYFVLKLLDKFYWRNNDLQYAMGLLSSDIRFGQRRINSDEYKERY